MKIDVNITFTEQNIYDLCVAANFGDVENGTKVFNMLKESPDMFEKFAAELKSTPFIDEIMEGSEDAIANDWLFDFDYENME